MFNALVGEGNTYSKAFPAKQTSEHIHGFARIVEKHQLTKLSAPEETSINTERRRIKILFSLTAISNSDTAYLELTQTLFPILISLFDRDPHLFKMNLGLYSRYAMYDICESLAAAYLVSNRGNNIETVQFVIGSTDEFSKCRMGLDAARRRVE
ncbi:MAG: hypothetical protein ABJN40_04060 [Sneathiella sp.]